MTIGEKLKRERKKMGHDLDSVAHKTKIAKMFLIAIENDDLSSLPGGVYTRNFLRAYAKFLNLDEDIITAEYHEQYDVKPHFVVHQEQTKRDDGQFKRQRSRFLLGIFLFLLVIAAIVVAWLYFPFWKKEPVAVTHQSPLTANRSLSEPSSQEPQTPTPSDSTRSMDPAPTETGAALPDQQGAEPTPQTDLQTDSNAQVAEALSDPPALEPGAETRESTENAPVQRTAEALASSQLPFSSVTAVRTFIEEQGLQPAVFYGTAAQLDQLFIIEAVAEVDLEVYVDGTMATRRLLKPGQIRFYSYGNYNRVIISDISKVNIQDGNQVFSGSGREPQDVFVNDFEPGNFLIQLRKTLNAEL